jgi:Major Facilitator Superfamily
MGCWPLVSPLSSVPAERDAQAGLMKVLGAVWLPGFGSSLSSVGFGAMIAFSSLLSAERGWNPVWISFSAFAIALVAARLFLGHTPDRLGGAKVALVCVFIEVAGLALIWAASNPVLAAAGAALTGFGYSLVYPGLGVEAVRRAPPQSRGLAMGAYTVFLDVALGFGTPRKLGRVRLRVPHQRAHRAVRGRDRRVAAPRAVPCVSAPTAEIGDHHEAFRPDTRIVLPARLRTGVGCQFFGSAAPRQAWWSVTHSRWMADILSAEERRLSGGDHEHQATSCF